MKKLLWLLALLLVITVSIACQPNNQDTSSDTGSGTSNSVVDTENNYDTSGT